MIRVMLKKLKGGLLFLILLLPAAQFAWRCREMPEFGYLHDDAMLFVSAKSVAHGAYRIESLPERPAETKYPPLYPLFLSFIWRMDPNFPDNLKLGTAFSFAVLAVFLTLVWFYYRHEFSSARCWAMLALVAVNPYLILFGCTLFSEVFFTCWVLATLLALSRPGLRMTVAAGLFAGCAYLSRTAGIALLVSVPAVLLLKKEARRAGVFAAAMLPAVAGWMWWTRTHGIHSPDPTLVYYTDYVRYEFLNVGVDNLALVLWKNLDQLLWSMGSLVLPNIVSGGAVKILRQVIAVAMIAGTVRMVRRGQAPHYAAFAGVSAAILLLWHFPPTERFVLPLFPLLLMGLVAELEHFADGLKAVFRGSDAGQKIAGVGFAAICAAIVVAALGLQFYGTFSYLEQTVDQKRQKLAQLRQAYSWMSANLPPAANVLAYDDPLLFLYTGHRGNYLPLMPRWWYADDSSAMIAAYSNLRDYCRGRGLQYVYFTNDLDRELGDDLRSKVEREVKGEPELAPLYSTQLGTIYKIGQ